MKQLKVMQQFDVKMFDYLIHIVTVT